MFLFVWTYELHLAISIHQDSRAMCDLGGVGGGDWLAGRSHGPGDSRWVSSKAGGGVGTQGSRVGEVGNRLVTWAKGLLVGE